MKSRKSTEGGSRKSGTGVNTWGLSGRPISLAQTARWRSAGTTPSSTGTLERDCRHLQARGTDEGDRAGADCSVRSFDRGCPDTAGAGLRSVLAAMARATQHRSIEDRDAAHRVERVEERALEDRDSRPGIGNTRGLGR